MVIVGALLAVLMVLVPAIVALATNVATSTTRWPGPLDLVRRYPWPALGIFVVLMVVLVIITAVINAAAPSPVSKDEMAKVADGLHQHLNEIEFLRVEVEDRVTVLPPHPRALLLQMDTPSRDRVWKLVMPFTDVKIDPKDLAKEWAATPPAALGELPMRAQLIVAELLITYGQPRAAIIHLRQAVAWGATPRTYWLFRVAQLHAATDGETSPELEATLAEVDLIDSSYPLAKALRAHTEAAWAELAHELENWRPATRWEQDTALLFRAVALQLGGRLDEAIAVLDTNVGDTDIPSHLLQHSRLLRGRAASGTGDSRLGDAQRAVELAVRARNLRRLWRLDSAEATATAAEAAMIAEDSQLVWTLTRPAPEGQATEAEAADPRVLPLAAMGAALTGRIAHARELVPAEDGYVRRRVLAEIASASDDDSTVDAWQAVLDAAKTDEEKIRALRGLAMEGATDRDVLNDLRSRQPEVVAEIELTVEVQAVSGPGTDERLRVLEAHTPLASVRRADLIRHEDPERAAQVLLDATERWQYPRLLVMAMSCYEDAGLLPQAEEIAKQALVRFGSSWPNRVTILLRLFHIQSTRRDWVNATATARTLLENDPNDQDMRWGLAWAQFRSGDPEAAWRTLKRPAAPLTPRTPTQAFLLLDLTRRYGPADDVAQTALAMLQVFPDDQDVHAAAIGTVTMRTDRADLPDDVNAQITQAWQTFLERYPDNQLLRAHTVPADNPLAAIEPILRQQAEAYQEVLRLVRDDGLPVGLLQYVVRKPYSSIFLYRPLGYHPMVYRAPQDQAAELAMARAALSGGCLVDASALHTLALLPDIAPTLLALIDRPTITDAGLQDLAEADDMLSMPGSGTVTYDPATGRAVAIHNDPDITTRQLTQIRAMLTTARGLRRLTHPELLNVPSLEWDREPAWNLTLDAAKHHNLPLWADDTGLRTAAHQLGIKTFSTYALLTAAFEQQRIDIATLRNTTRALIHERVVDLPFDHELLMEIAAEENWEPRSVATVLSRNATWTNGRRALDLFLAAFTNATDTYAQTWAHAALAGLCDTTDSGSLDDQLKALSVITLAAEASRPERAARFVAAIESITPERAENVVRGALANLWSKITATMPTKRAVTAFLQIISCLNDNHRQYGTHLILKVD